MFKNSLVLLILSCLSVQLIGQKTSEKGQELLRIADNWERNNFDSSLHYSHLALEVAERDGAIKTQINAKNNIGYSLARMSRYPEAYAFHQDALEMAQLHKDTAEIAKTQNFIGVYFNSLSDYESALENFLDSYELRVKLNDTIGRAVVAGNIGLNYYRIKEYDLAEEYMNLTYQIDSTLKDSLYLIGDLINIGLVYKFTDRLAKSEKVTLQALDIARKFDSKVDIALCLGNLGMIYIQDENYKKAEQYLNQSLSLRQEIGKPRDLVITYTNLTRLYQNWGKYEKSLVLADSAEYYNAIVKNKSQELKLLDSKAKTYLAKGQYRKAYAINKQLMVLKDSMSSDLKLKKLASVQARLNLLEKENDLIRQEGEIEKLESQSKIRMQWTVFGFGSLGALFAIFYLLRSRAYNKKNATLQRQYAQDLIKSTEQERKRISSELHDSIGQSLLLIKNKILLNPEEVKEDISIVNEAIDEVRSISQALHPYQFEKLGLLKSLEFMMNQFQAHSNIFYSHDIEIDTIALKENQGIYIYRIIQECINNVEKHANAKACNLTVEEHSNHFFFQVKDNGRGFDLTKNANLLNSLGMKTLKERAQIIGAQLIIDSELNKGTVVKLKVPK